MWMLITRRVTFLCSELKQRNAQFVSRVKANEKKFKLHEQTKHIKQEDINKWTADQSKKELSDRIVRQSKHDFDVKSYVKKFNADHQGKINLLDFSNYTTEFGDFKENAISKKDMEIIREFQKRKIDQRLHRLQKIKASSRGGNSKDHSAVNPLEYYQDVQDELPSSEGQIELQFRDQAKTHYVNPQLKKGWFDVQDDFMMLLLERNTSTKITTLNRINFYRTLLFMGNGNGLISYGKSRDLTPQGSLTKAIIQCKKNIIAIPLDDTCTMPRHINSRFQDFHAYIRPLPGFNSYGHPFFSLMLGLAGVTHAGFKTVHTDKNRYTMLHSFFKAITQNTTPQDMAEKQGFKVYRHRFIRPLTKESTHNHLSR